jgi:hypothetical protein
MFRDDRLEYKDGTLQLKQDILGANLKNDKKTLKPKSKRTTKFDFSGTNYETCTRGHVACLETMVEEVPEMIEDICKQARDLASIRKSSRDDRYLDNNESKYATLQTDPEFLARASLFKNLKGKKSNGRARATLEDNEGNDSNY